MNPALIQHLSDATQVFAAVAVLCVLVTGFFIGRGWLRGIGGDGSLPGERDSASKHWRKL